MKTTGAVSIRRILLAVVVVIGLVGGVLWPKFGPILWPSPPPRVGDTVAAEAELLSALSKSGFSNRFRFEILAVVEDPDSHYFSIAFRKTGTRDGQPVLDDQVMVAIVRPDGLVMDGLYFIPTPPHRP